MNILLINGHEYWKNSPGRLNQSLLEFAEQYFVKKKHQVVVSIAESDFDIETEVQKFIQADLILYITPVFWMGMPAAFKFYLDRVYSGGRGKLYMNDGRVDGGEYGSAGLLKAKYSLITTWNAPSEAFNRESAFLFGNKSVDDVFFNFHSAQKFIGLQQLPSCSLHDVTKNPDYKVLILQFEEHLQQLIN